MNEEVIEILRDVKTLAQRYYRLTGRPLGVTGEVAEYEAWRLLGVQLADVRQPGYDATEGSAGAVIRYQIKGRCFDADFSNGQRMGSLSLKKEWDSVLLVLLNRDFETREIWEASRSALEPLLTLPGSKARTERGQIGVAQFRRVGRRIWPRSPDSELDVTSALAPNDSP